MQLALPATEHREKRRRVSQHAGWLQVAFVHELLSDVNPVDVAGHRLIAVKTQDGWKCFDGTCPHRGAHLGHGGVFDGAGVVCPFHAYRVGLGQARRMDLDTPDCAHALTVRAYATLEVAGLLFVRLSESPSTDPGFEVALRDIAATHHIVPGFSLNVDVPGEIVIENGFDSRHFLAVHGVRNDPKFELVETHELGPDRVQPLCIRSTFEIPDRMTPAKTHLASFCLRAFSPTISLGQMDGAMSYTLITSATSIGERTSVVRVSLALPTRVYGASPSPQMIKGMLSSIQAGLEQDVIIWKNLDIDTPPRFLANERSLQAFHKFCDRFELSTACADSTEATWQA
jgi:3-ketosteroid 9alpha-monooxygenase subunit A